MFPGFPIIKMTGVLLISVQSSFLLVPPGSQLWHHVTAKVTLCLGCLLEEQTGPASRSTNRPHIRGTESQTHYKLDCDYSGKPTQSIPNTLTQRSCFHYPIAFFFFSPHFSIFKVIPDTLQCFPLSCDIWALNRDYSNLKMNFQIYHY